MATCSGARHVEDFHIDGEHDNERNVERANGRVDDVAGLLAKDALTRDCRILPINLPPSSRISASYLALADDRLSLAIRLVMCGLYVFTLLAKNALTHKYHSCLLP